MCEAKQKPTWQSRSTPQTYATKWIERSEKFSQSTKKPEEWKWINTRKINISQRSFSICFLFSCWWRSAGVDKLYKLFRRILFGLVWGFRKVKEEDKGVTAQVCGNSQLVCCWLPTRTMCFLNVTSTEGLCLRTKIMFIGFSSVVPVTPAQMLWIEN